MAKTEKMGVGPNRTEARREKFRRNLLAVLESIDPEEKQRPKQLKTITSIPISACRTMLNRGYGRINQSTSKYIEALGRAFGFSDDLDSIFRTDFIFKIDSKFVKQDHDNPVLIEMIGARKLEGLTENQIERIKGTRGVGGALTEEGVLERARKEKRKKEIHRKADAVMETHLIDLLERIVEAFYDETSVPGH